MTMRPFTDARGGLNHLVDAQIGRAFPVVHKVYENLEEIVYLANVFQSGRSRDIELRTNLTNEWVEWRYAGADSWTVLFEFKNLLGAGLADLIAAEQAITAELMQLRTDLEAGIAQMNILHGETQTAATQVAADKVVVADARTAVEQAAAVAAGHVATIAAAESAVSGYAADVTAAAGAVQANADTVADSLTTIQGHATTVAQQVTAVQAAVTTADQSAQTAVQSAATATQAATNAQAAQAAVAALESTVVQQAADVAAAVPLVGADASAAAQAKNDAQTAAQAAAQSAADAASTAGTVGVKSAAVDSNGHLIITRNNDSNLDAGLVRGADGVPGVAGVPGPPGAGLKVLGTVVDEADLPSSNQETGDAYVINTDLWIWNGTAWFNAGPVKGDKGDEGAQGIQGIQGPQGVKGDKGDKGDVGDTGPQGIQGIQGPVGPQGIPGIKGDTGDTGPQGVPGVKGDTGDQGIQGPQGIPGVKGDTGDTGPAGSGASTVAQITDATALGKQVLAAADAAALRTLADTSQFTAAEKTKLSGVEAGAQVNAVTSVAGKTGSVSLEKADVGLGNVDNTSDASKPVSTAQAAAIAAKEPTITAGTTSQFWRGDKSWQDLAAAVRAAVLTGLSTATSTVVGAADSVLVAIGKLQAQVSLRAPIAAPSFTGTATFQGLKESPVVANSGSAYTVNFSTSSITDLTLTANTTLTFPTATAGAQGTLLITQDATGSRTVTWPSSIRWASGTAPTLTATAAKTDVISFLAVGNYWLGFVGGQNYTRA